MEVSSVKCPACDQKLFKTLLPGGAFEIRCKTCRMFTIFALKDLDNPRLDAVIVLLWWHNYPDQMTRSMRKPS